MTYLGFLFDISSCNSKIINNTQIKKDFIVVFIDFKKPRVNPKDNFIVGINSFKENESEFFYLGNNQLEDFLVFEKALFKSARIRVYDQKMIDFEYLTFWFEGQDYRQIRETLYIDETIVNLELEIKNRIKFLINYFI